MKGKYISIGDKHGRLSAISNDEMINGVRMVECVCECGEVGVYRVSDLRSGNTKSCGCLYKKTRKTIRLTHGLTDSRIYSIWTNMKTRCYNPKVKGYENYGGRGISICEEWLTDFTDFYDWSIKSGYQDDLTIERVDVNGNYEPKNCMWIKPEKQSENRRGNIYIEFEGQKDTLKGWCDKFGIPYKNVHQRMVRRSLDPKENLLFYIDKTKTAKRL